MPEDDRIEEIFRTALSRKAEAAPPERGLARLVRTRLVRRRRRRVAGATVACVAVIAGVMAVVQGSGSDSDRGRPDVVQRPDRPTTESTKKPDNWRWESYGGVEVAVPRWNYGRTGQPPCLMTGAQGPYVGRPGTVETIGCADPIPPLGKRKPYLWFDNPVPTGARTYDHGWVAETRIIGSVPITVFSDDAEERRQIFETARVVDRVDLHGCPINHPISEEPTRRPEPVDGGLETVGIVQSVSICRYHVVDPLSSYRLMHPLIASDRAGVGAFVRTIRSAPEGTGPNSPEHCLLDVAYGDEAIVLILHGERHDQQVFVRYSGCDGHGIDDGTTQRELTGDMLWALTEQRGPPLAITDSTVADLVPIF
ncbi:MAG TPA: hypothetical protein VEX15_16740 [Nocardioidaceae bacterium]|nr:hypothetical protein [Nocardioidaceae bacterium]